MPAEPGYSDARGEEDFLEISRDMNIHNRACVQAGQKKDIVTKPMLTPRIPRRQKGRVARAWAVWLIITPREAGLVLS